MTGNQYVQVGCGFSPGRDWLNFDASPMLRIERLPVLGGIARRAFGSGFPPFPSAVRYGDIVRGLPLEPGSVKLIYASHVFEHMALNEMRAALANCHKLLQPGGTLRLIVPDLQKRAELYLAKTGEEGAADWLMEQLFMGVRERQRGWKQMIRDAIGNSRHLWMYDEAAMRAELVRAGFGDVRRASYGDSGDPILAQVENPDRFRDGEVDELALDAVKASVPATQPAQALEAA